ncbi:winged helix DNA-binding domain-containing protein [Mycolicibacterium sp. F2034L]|uniref:winged helix DNA-binding domain-containing protein n=1 Tax=Mycolicibacterium sp. F2034L TaxID=2926422 RepID=UPI001FF30102|nr:winged helix DNA-binding domain-containing protein [Mycolicibacterium sp. F2034L]MCK0173276.1 winged helix DNA-binding domain-containing protein [Mycolicibacterium sp. F2034L]
MRSFTLDERRDRLARRHFLCAEPDSLTDVVTGVVGLHATDPATPYLSLWARVPGFTVADLDAELYARRTLLKHLAMRRTLWMISRADLPAVQAAASDRVAATERRRLVADAQKGGVTPDAASWLDTACAAVLGHLQAHGPTGARQLRAALPELAGSFDAAPGKPWGGDSPLSPRVLTVLGVQGDIVRGPNDGGWTASRPRWATIGDWLGEPNAPLDAEEASRIVVRRWLRAFGPATVTDVKWWFGNTLTWARSTLEAIGAVEVDLHGSPGVALPDDLEPEPACGPWAALLPGLDVTTMGWYDREWYLGPHRPYVFDRNGNGGPTAWWNGRIVGGWGQDADARVVLHLVEDVGRDGLAALSRRAADLTSWLDGTRIAPRFPSPLIKARFEPPEAG